LSSAGAGGIPIADAPRKISCYLAQALRDYRSGARKHAIMLQQVTDLSDEDIAGLALYYAAQPGLFVK